VKFRASFSVNLETCDFRFVEIHFRWKDHYIGEIFQEHMRKAGSKTSTIDIVCPAFGNVDLLASWTEDLESRGSWDVADTNWKHFLFVAKSTRTVTVTSTEELLIDHSLASGRIYISCMYQTVKISCLLIELQETFILEVLLIWGDR
jgi:hypothetical protein